MIYVDTSVALAHLLAQDRRPPVEIWSDTLVSSRLLEYELWTRIHARGLTSTHSDAARTLIGRIAFLELITDVLERALAPFPTRFLRRAHAVGRKEAPAPPLPAVAAHPEWRTHEPGDISGECRSQTLPGADHGGNDRHTRARAH